MRHETFKGNLGAIRISDSAIATLVSIAVLKVPKVVDLGGSFFDYIIESIGELFGKRFKEKGVKVNLGEKEVSIEISAVVEFGADIGEVGSQIQERIRDAVENMTGLVVSEINVNITSVES